MYPENGPARYVTAGDSSPVWQHDAAMLKFGGLALDRSRPLVAAVFTDGSSARTIRRAQADGMDLAELRIDLFRDTSRRHVLGEARKFIGVPTIATIRSRVEGGAWQGSEPARLALFRAVVPSVSAVDIELGSAEIRDEVMATAHHALKPVIVSFHDFVDTPTYPELRRKLNAARAAGADVVKIATHTPDDRALTRLARLLVNHPGTPLVVLAMGPVGVKSRVLFPALGSLFTFASLTRQTAPGQLGLRQTRHALRLYYPAAGRPKP